MQTNKQTYTNVKCLQKHNILDGCNYAIVYDNLYCLLFCHCEILLATCVRYKLNSAFIIQKRTIRTCKL